MGHVHQSVTLTARTSETVRMLVDTDATFTVIPPEIARRIGITPLGRQYEVRLADGSKVSWEVGSTLIRVDGREAPATVLIGQVDEPLLGVEALEGLGLAVDPCSGTLKETRSYSVRVGPPLEGLRSPP